MQYALSQVQRPIESVDSRYATSAYAAPVMKADGDVRKVKQDAELALIELLLRN